MKTKSSIAMILTAAALMIPGLPLHAADDHYSDKTMGEKTDDAMITSKVKMELMGNSGTSAMRTEVDTNNGVVTLSGTAKSTAEKELATQIAKKVKGVTKVNNRMTVQSEK
ncbi:BON domain-containing protein [Pelotalea chapellei]|uniref:BON domain-containing protein n=1 Tax=Pelotalea chapellei TaxID=44671 RepID=A0ABS5U931_9BACT|nr:BON domain-containing protein [Pelotalea chapellei]MBT1072177.1 BON domain-containing protein [Pelotalea chapellei]